jgi:hypothetical protein
MTAPGERPSAIERPYSTLTLLSGAYDRNYQAARYIWHDTAPFWYTIQNIVRDTKALSQRIATMGAITIDSSM